MKPCVLFPTDQRTGLYDSRKPGRASSICTNAMVKINLVDKHIGNQSTDNNNCVLHVRESIVLRLTSCIGKEKRSRPVSAVLFSSRLGPHGPSTAYHSPPRLSPNHGEKRDHVCLFTCNHGVSLPGGLPPSIKHHLALFLESYQKSSMCAGVTQRRPAWKHEILNSIMSQTIFSIDIPDTANCSHL